MSEKKGKMTVDDGGGGQRLVEVSYPPNNHKSRSAKRPEKKVEKIITGKVVQRKKPLGEKIKETFLGDNLESVAVYILHDVLVPAAKNMISDTVSKGIEMLLFGQTRGSRTRRDGSRSYVSYESQYDRNARNRSTANRSRHNFDDIILESRGEAEEVLSHLVELIDTYGAATVADLYDLVDITSNYTDDKYGWVNLKDAYVSRVREGYMLKLPKTIVID